MAQCSPVSMEFLESQLPPIEQQATAPPRPFTGLSSFDAEQFIAQHLDVDRVVQETNRKKIVLRRCPFNEDHKSPDAAVFVGSDGKLGFKCLHSSCSDKGWREVRQLFEPGAYQRRTEFTAAPSCQGFNGADDVGSGQDSKVPKTFIATDSAVEDLPAPDYSVPGFVGEMMRDTLSTAPYPNEALAFGGALTMQSLLCGRKIRDEQGIFPNIYLVTLANSGTGKDHPRKRNAALLQSLGMTGSLGDGIASGQGLEDFLYVTRCAILQLDEFDSVLAAVNRPQDSIASFMNAVLLKLYSTAGSVYSLRLKAGEERRQIINPHLTLFGTATPQGFLDNLTAKNVVSGLLPRMITLEAGRRGEGQDAINSGLSLYVTSTAKEWVTPAETDGNLEIINPIPITVPQTGDAKRIFADARRQADELFDQCQATGDDTGCAILSRTIENARKLALLHAASEMGKQAEISRTAAEWAIGFAKRQTQWLLRKLEGIGGDSVFEASAQKFLDRLRKSGGRETRSKMLRAMKCDVQQFDRLVQTLTTREQVESETVATKGRSGLVYLLSPFFHQ